MMNVIVAGSDGYIGFPLCLRLLNKGFNVVGIDNGLRRKMVSELKSESATKIDSIENRITNLKNIGNFLFYDIDVAKDSELLRDIIKKHKPDAIINLAHQPAAAYSMISRYHAELSLINNYLGTNNFLWFIREYVPDCHYITIGTTGEYDHYSNIDIEEGYIFINHKGRMSKEMIYPRRCGSIYHGSKIASTYLIDFCTRAWGLKCTDIMQSIVYGVYTKELEETKFNTRLDTDESFGTVLNRFIVQALMKVPLTVYGEGKHQRGFLALSDSIQALEIAIDNPPNGGRVQVWNQLCEWKSMLYCANLVKKILKEYNIDVRINHIPSPRTEQTNEHYYKYTTDILKSKGFKQTRTMKEEIKFAIEKIDKNIISNLNHVVMPRIFWN